MSTREWAKQEMERANFDEGSKQTFSAILEAIDQIVDDEWEGMPPALRSAVHSLREYTRIMGRPSKTDYDGPKPLTETAFLHKRRGELVIERDRARAELTRIYDILAGINDEVEVGADGYARFGSVNDADRLRALVSELEPAALADHGTRINREAFGGELGDAPKESPLPAEKGAEIGAVSFEGELREALRIFVGCAYPVSTEINPRGHNWSEGWLDEALANARAVLKAHESQAASRPAQAQSGVPE